MRYRFVSVALGLSSQRRSSPSCWRELLGAPPSSAQQTTPEPLAFGAYAKPRNGQSERQAVEALEAQIGRKLAVVARLRDLGPAVPRTRTTRG